MEVDIVACAGKLAVPSSPCGFYRPALPDSYNLKGDEVHDVGSDQGISAVLEASAWKYSEVEYENRDFRQW